MDHFVGKKICRQIILGQPAASLGLLLIFPLINYWRWDFLGTLSASCPVMAQNIEQLVEELKKLDAEFVEINGTRLRPSQCYHFEADPAHVLFNTNCPDTLKQKINAILARHIVDYESRSSQQG
jgi:hypothetical protein